MSHPWDSGEDVSYNASAVMQPASPVAAYPAHPRIALLCSEHGQLHSVPGPIELHELVAMIEQHHHDAHGGPESPRKAARVPKPRKPEPGKD